MSLDRESTELAPKKVPITVEMKNEIIRRYEAGKRIIHIPRELGKASSTIAMIPKKEDVSGFAVS